MAAASGIAVGVATAEQSVVEESAARAAMIGPRVERAGASAVATPMHSLTCSVRVLLKCLRSAG